MSDLLPSLYKITIPPSVRDKLYYYSNAVEAEISGFGKTLIKKDVIHVLDVVIFKQVCTGGHTELDKEALSKFVVGLAQKGEDPTRWNLWWHSHYDFAPFFSQTDTDTIEELSKATKLIAVCTNQSSLFVGCVGENGIIEDAEMRVLPSSGKLKRACTNEVKRLVRVGSAVDDVDICVDEPDLRTTRDDVYDYSYWKTLYHR